MYPSFALFTLFLSLTTASPILVGSALKTVDEKAPLRILPLGDSITWGAGQPSSKGTNGYRAQLLLNLQEAGYNIDFVGTQKTGTMVDNDNEGRPGFRINQIKEIAGPALAMKPDVVLIHAGTNDLLQADNTKGETWEAAPARAGQLVSYVAEQLPNALIVVAQIIQSGRPQAAINNREFNKRLPSEISRLQKKGLKVLYVDQGVISAKETYDKVHPTNAAYKRMGNIWAEAIKSADKKGLVSKPSDIL